MTQFSAAPERMIGRTALDSSGEKIGKIGQVYLDDQSGQPVWITVSTGLFGSKQSFAPIGGAREQGEDIWLAVTKQQIKDAPNVEDDGHLNETEQDELYRYYGSALATSGGSGYADTEAGRADYVESAQAESAQAQSIQAESVAAESGNDDAMTRSEERLHVGTERVEAGRARLRKFIVTENVTMTVPVSREEVRLVREPITEGTSGEPLDGPELTEAEHEVTLYAERTVVTKETVPVERVRLATDTVTSQESVEGTVRKEQIEVEDEPGEIGRTTR